MADEMMVKELEEVVVRFSGDSGDGMQLAGNIFSNVSATVGNDICTFPDYPADIRAPQGSLTGVSRFSVHVGASKIFTPGDHCHVLVAMNPAALKTQIKFCKPQGLVITDSDSFGEKDLEKAQFKTGNPFEEMGITQQVLEVPISSMCKESLKNSGAGQQSHVALQKHVRSRFSMLVIQPQPVCCRKNAEREIRKKTGNCRCQHQSAK